MNPLCSCTRWWLSTLAFAALGCGSAQRSPAPTPPPAPSSVPPPMPPPPPGAEPQTSAGEPCDGQWYRSRHGDFNFECRCRVLGSEEKNADGVGQAEVVARMNSLSPVVVASDEGLFEALGLSPPRCGEAKVSWQFAATEPAQARQCRRGGEGGPEAAESVSVRGELQVALEPGHRERLVGTANVPPQRPAPWSPEANDPGLTAYPRLSFRSEPRGRLVLMAHQERGRFEVLAVQPGARPGKTAFFMPKVLTLDAFEATFGTTLKAWLARMRVVSQSCVIVKGTRPPQIPPPSAEPPTFSSHEITEPVAVNAKILRTKLLDLTDRPCDQRGARISLQIASFPGLAPATVVGSADIAEDRRRMTWPTDPSPTEPGPAAVVHLGSSGRERFEVPVPKWLADSVPCAAGKKGRFEAHLAAVRGKAGLETSIVATWGTPCSPATMRCKFETRSP
jgi:hypothetical protein